METCLTSNVNAKSLLWLEEDKVKVYTPSGIIYRQTNKKNCPFASKLKEGCNSVAKSDFLLINWLQELS